MPQARPFTSTSGHDDDDDVDDHDDGDGDDDENGYLDENHRLDADKLVLPPLYLNMMTLCDCHK